MTKSCFLPFISTFYFFLFLLTVMASCQQEKENSTTIVEFPQQVNLVGENIEEVTSYDPRDLLIVDSLLIILNKQGDYFIQYYNKNSFKLLGEYGTKGKGPGEFIHPMFTGQPINKINNKTTLVIFDWLRRNLNYIDISESINNKDYLCKTEKLNENITNAQNIMYNNDSIICIIPEDEKSGRFLIYNKKTDNMKNIPFPPKVVNKIHPNNLYSIYVTVGKALLPENNIFLAMPFCIGQLDYFDLNGNYLKTIMFHENEYLEKAYYPNDVETIKGFKCFNSRIRVIEDEIFILFQVLQYPNGTSKTKSKIYVINKEGIPIKEYELDKNILHFDIDTANHRFIGFAPNEEQFPIVKFNF